MKETIKKEFKDKSKEWKMADKQVKLNHQGGRWGWPQLEWKSTVSYDGSADHLVVTAGV